MRGRTAAGSAALILATWFGAGLMPKAPGTWGSAAALPFAWAIASLFGPHALLPAAALLFLVGWAASAHVVRLKGAEDPQTIVVDEVVGIWLTLAFVPPGWLAYLLGFAFFRAADILKPFPAGWADARIGGGLGVMADDALAALYSCLTVTLLMKVV